MRITFVLPYAGLQGGVRVVSIYADRLRKRGHRVTVISSPLQTRLRSRAKALALRLRGVPVNRSPRTSRVSAWITGCLIALAT